MRALRDDLELAYRSVVGRPGTSLLVVLSVAVAIGANTGFFGVMRGFVLQPLPYPQQARLVCCGRWTVPPPIPRPASRLPTSSPGATSCVASARSPPSTPPPHAVTSSEPAEEVNGARVTAGLLPLFGARVARGRSLEPADMAPGAPPVALITDEYWRHRFGADPGIVGRTLRVDEHETTVVGVLAADFHFLYTGFALWTPLAIASARRSCLPSTCRW